MFEKLRDGTKNLKGKWFTVNVSESGHFTINIKNASNFTVNLIDCKKI